MKIILLKDVPKIGRRYEIKEVSDGYARNFLIKNKLGEIATDAVIKKAEDEKKKMNADKANREAKINEQITNISKEPIIVYSKANEEGHLFAGIKKEEILKLIKNKGADIKPEELEMDKPIKETGSHEVTIKISGKTAKIRLEVTAKK
ncbi:MAG: 50S ribosomal protein L9 [Parcubacteria group bacterium GW2011_GWF2_38_76]|nr:MAG: 50S ribosomal protein L9 [Parcubacteria group bacterium GW2011_GWF2_38_76]HBM45617.1 50S ribosomal protein L9 [Patescibacteria group bacterium]